MHYKHTQIGTLMIFTAFAVATLFSVLLLTTKEDILFITPIMVIVLIILASFSTLNVAVDAEKIRIKFGYGIFRKSFELKEIVSAKSVKNHWYYGWGIRYWMWPRMMILNVSGFDAVEIRMKNSKIYRIGTDEPIRLERAIVQAIT